MSNRMTVLYLVLSLWIIASSTSASASINGFCSESLLQLNCELGSDSDEFGPWDYKGDYWSAFLDFSTPGPGYLLVMWGYMHTANPHSGDTDALGILLGTIISDSSYGLVIDQSGTYPHQGDGHYEEWSFKFNRSLVPEDTSFILTATHVAPEPLGSVLFLVGGAVIGLRKFFKRKPA